MMDSTDQLYKILRDFVEKIAERHLLDAKYMVYLYSLNGNENSYEMRLEACKETRSFDKIFNFPLPKNIGKSWKIPYEKYQFFAYGRGGDIISCETIYGYNASLKKEVHNAGYWSEKFAFFYRYRCSGYRLLIFLIFDIDPNGTEGHKIMSIDLFPILKGVEDIHHKNNIFYMDYLNLLREKIGKKIFPKAYESIRKLSQGFRYTEYLLKNYYDFLYSNLKICEDIGVTPEQQEKFLLLTEEFEESQKNLFRIPQYRDHFLHQCNVYLLGIAILSILKSNNYIPDFKKCLNKAYRPKGMSHKYKNNQEAAFAWFIASMFHDIAYPVEKSHQLVESFFKRYILPHKFGKSIFKQNLNIFKAFFDLEYSHCIEELAEIHWQLNTSDEKIKYQDLRGNITLKRGNPFRQKIMRHILDFQDHGVLSAIMLLNRFETDTSMFKYLLPATAAISIHNLQWIDWNEFTKPCKFCSTINTGCTSCENWKKAYDTYFGPELRFFDFNKDPLGFLLCLCDMLQDWGRYDFENMENAYESFYNQSRIIDIRTENKNIIIDLTLTPTPEAEDRKMNFLLYKKQEIAQVFSRLKFINDHDIVVNFITEEGVSVSFSMNSFK